jgi:hypothetical protein
MARRQALRGKFLVLMPPKAHQLAARRKTLNPVLTSPLLEMPCQAMKMARAERM